MLGDSYPLANQPGNGEFTIPKSYECLCQVGFLSMSSFLTGRNCLGSPLDTHIHIYIYSYIYFFYIYTYMYMFVYIYIIPIRYIHIYIYTYGYVLENEWQELLTYAVWAIAENRALCAIYSSANTSGKAKMLSFILFEARTFFGAPFLVGTKPFFGATWQSQWYKHFPEIVNSA